MKKAAAKAASAKTVRATKAPAKRAPAKKAPAKRAPSKKGAARQTPAGSPDAYLRAIDADLRAHLETLRRLVKRSVPRATETIAWGMIAYAIDGRPFAGLAARDSGLRLYLMDVYSQPGLREKHAAALRGLKMGKSCITFRSVDDLPLDVIAAILEEAPRVVVRGGTMAKLP